MKKHTWTEAELLEFVQGAHPRLLCIRPEEARQYKALEAAGKVYVLKYKTHCSVGIRTAEIS